MKLLDLEARNFRGLVNFSTTLSGVSIAIDGNNATGKSGVVDAVEFLLTGKVTRLTGEGSGDLTLDEHAKHVDKSIDDSYVKATIRLQTGAELVVFRSLKDKKLKKISGDDVAFASLEDIASSGHFLLTRREVLRFITCESRKRSEEVQTLMELSCIEKMRADLGSAYRNLESGKQAAELALTQAEQAISSKLETVNKTDWVTRLNGLRAALNALPISDLNDSKSISGGFSVIAIGQKGSDKKTLGTLISKLESSLTADESLNERLKKFQETVNAISQFADYEQCRERADLIELGISQIGSDPMCPLCDSPWENDKLLLHLEKKRQDTLAAQELEDAFLASTRLLEVHINQVDETLREIKNLLTDNEDVCVGVGKWRGELQQHRTLLSHTRNAGDLKKKVKESELFFLQPAEGHKQVIDELYRIHEGLPEPSVVESNARVLTEVAVMVDSLHQKYSALESARIRYEACRIAKETFEAERERVLSELYKTLESDFVSFYRLLNEDDEANFTATLKDEGNKLSLKVDFLNRGLAPPNAFHSDGHQDGMGICLFLAIMKQLKGSAFSLCLLDDVMLSIDTGHRRQLSLLLLKKFPETQFLITTHDKTWARQLREYGAVRKENSLHFRSWTAEDGPIFDTKSAWGDAREKCDRGDVPAAAAALRRNLELEFQEGCEDLHGNVKYRGGHNWSLNEFKDSALKALRDTLRKAKNWANSNDKSDVVANISRREEAFDKAAKNARVEEWMLNPAVHYNEWANFSKSEMKELIGQMEVLIGCFACGECKTKLHLIAPVGNLNPDFLMCKCGESRFALV